MKTAHEKSVLVRARVPSGRYQRAEHILESLGLKTNEAINIFYAQVERHQGLPFSMTLQHPSLLTAEQQADEWMEALGEY